MKFILILFVLIQTSPVRAQEWMGYSTSAFKQPAKSYSSVFDFHADKKVGLGANFAGSMGILGFNFHLYFAQDVGISLGYGVSRGFQALNLQVRQHLSDRNISPYVVGGHSRWFSRDLGEVGETTPRFFGQKFLSAQERRDGGFAENIIYPGFGLQYYNLNGEWLGATFYAEVLLLTDIDDFQIEPTAGTGTVFYF